MGPLIRMAGLRDLRRYDGVSNVSATVLGDGMSDLVKRLRDGCNLQQRDGERAAGRIEQLERELDAERVLADSMAEILKNCDVSTGYCCCGDLADHHGMGSGHSPVDEGAYHSEKALAAYRKARGIK